MITDIKSLKIPKCIKFVIFSCVFVCAVILFTNTGVSTYILGNKHTDIDPTGENIKHLNSKSLSKETIMGKGEENMKHANLKPNQTNTNINNGTADNCVSYHTHDDVPPCFRKYLSDVQTESQTSLKTLELIAKNNSFSDMLSSFNTLASSLGIKVSVIEPSVLHCTLENKYKSLLEKRKFNISNFIGSDRTLTYGIIGDDVQILQKEENIWKFRKLGFQPYFVQVPLATWMRENKTRLESETYTSHVFYMYYEWTIHVVVFHRRNTYLWHAALDSDNTWSIPKERDLLFVNYDSAYENFSFVHFDTHKSNHSDIYMPSEPHYFLFQIPKSRFLECNLSRAVNVMASSSSPESSSSSAEEKFNNRTLVALGELKQFFNSLLMNFWIFSGTMLGWYRQCDIIPYTSDVDFGAWASEIEDLDYIIKHFRNNKKLYILERMGMLEEALEFQLRSSNLRVDVFFMYKIHNGSWASGHRPSKGYYFRYHYPNFTLCSAELLNQKVQVPCETEHVILTEYGSEWMKPISSWNYESSIKNRGPNIYWDEKRRPKAFEEY